MRRPWHCVRNHSGYPGLLLKRLLGMGPILLIGVLAMSSASIMIRAAQGEGAPSLVIAAYRLTVATLILTFPALRQQAWREYATLGWREMCLLLLSGLLLGLHFATWITSLEHTSVISSVVLVTTTPLWIGLISPLVLGERTSGSTWIGMGIAMAGGIIIGLADDSHAAGRIPLLGDVLALAGALFAAGYMLIGRRVRSQLRLTAYLWLVYGTAAAVLIFFALMARQPLTGYSRLAAALMIALGLVPQLIGHSAANYALRHLPASVVGVTVLGEPIGSTLLAVAILGELPSSLQIVGAVVILIGIGAAATARARDPAAGLEAPAVARRSDRT